MSPSRADRVAIAQRLRAEGGGGEGLSIVAIAREMGISVSYVSSLLTDPTGEADRARKRKYLKRCKTCGVLCWGVYCREHAGKAAAGKRRKWTKEMIVEAIQEWEILYGHIPTGAEWARRKDLPDWVPLTRLIYDVFGKNGWNKAIEAAGFTPRPAHAPEWAQNTAAANVVPMGAEARERLSVERKALYAENPDHPMFKGLQEGWDIGLERRERQGRRIQRSIAKQAAKKRSTDT